jgi:bifunctional non-homologous end joining protein LigD
VRDFARVLARDVASSFPDIATVDAGESRRGKRVYINCSRNAYGQTVIVPYSLRAMEGAPVATPLDWKELGATDLSAEKYDIQSILRRLAQKSDPWDGMNRRASSLQKARERLESTVQSGAA